MPSLELATCSDVRAVGDEVRDFQLLWASIDSPWVHHVDPARFRATLVLSVPWALPRFSAATCPRYRSRTMGYSRPYCSHRRQSRSSGRTRRHLRLCSSRSSLPEQCRCQL
jgi:hypothetical protein